MVGAFGTALAALTLGLLWAPAAALATITIDTANHTVTTSKLALQFGNSTTNQPDDPERLDSITWTGSSGTQTANLAAEGGSYCSDKQEYWGQSYAFPEGNSPLVVVGGTIGSWNSPEPNQVQIDSSSPSGCGDAIPVTTTYSFFDSGAQANEFAVHRNIDFNNNSYSGVEGVRAYVPRLPLATYDQVLYQNSSGMLQQSGICDNCASISDWSGGWFADNSSASNSGVIVLRDAADNQPAHLAIDQDGYSNSNNTAVELLQPSGGWTSSVDETEYLCFYDSTNWPAADRQAGQTATLPNGCGTAPAITSTDGTAFTAGSPGSFTVTSTGTPTPSLSETGALPSGVTFTDNGNGTATLSGSPAGGSQGSYVITITAHSSFGHDQNQTFTLSVNHPGEPGTGTEQATNVGPTTATLNGSVVPFGLPTTATFEWGTGVGYGTSSPTIGVGNDYATHALQWTLNGLTPGQTYHFRVDATNSDGTSYGNDESFTTPSVAPQEVPGTCVGVNSPDPQYQFQLDPGGAPTTVYEDGGREMTFGSNADNGLRTVEVPLNLWTPGTTATINMTASNAAGTITWQASCLRPALPLVESASTNDSATTSVVSVTIDPQGSATSVHVEYGPTSAYGTSTAPVNSPQVSGTYVFRQTVSGLKPGHTYHFHVVAVNAGGNADSPDATFSTSSVVLRGGVLKLLGSRATQSVSCKTAVPCSGKVTLLSTGSLRGLLASAKQATIGSAHFQVKPHHRATIAIRLSHAAIRALRRHHKLQVIELVATRVGPGGSSVTRRTVELG